MINCILKVKINDFFPKIDAIPYKDLIFIIKYNNSYSKIKVTEKENKFFHHSLKIENNTDIILKIKLIDFMKNNILLGACDLLIPYQKINQMIRNIFLSYNQQVQLSINPSLKIKLLNKTLIISNIYLDLVIEITSVDNNKNYSNNKKICYSKSPIIPKYTNFYKNESNRTYGKSVHNNNYYKNMDINYNVINNNYLNYIANDNNNYFINYNVKPSKPSHNIRIKPPDEYILENNKRFNSYINSNKTKYSNFSDEKIYHHNTTDVRKNLFKNYIISPNMTEIINNYYNGIDKNEKNAEIIKDNYINTFNDEDNMNNLSNKQKIQNNFHNMINKDISLSPSYYKKNLEVNPFNYNISQNFGKSRNPKKRREISISSVLKYFNHVKAFNPKVIKTNENKEAKYSNRQYYNNENINNDIIDEYKNELNNNDVFENYNQDDLKEKIIKLMNDNTLLAKEMKQKINIHQNLIKKYFLYKEKYYSELKKQNLLINHLNIKEIKKIIHVNRNSKLNEVFYQNMKKIKNIEFFIIEKIFKNNKAVQAQKKIKEKLEQQKIFHVLLNIIRNLIKNFNNISHIYNGQDNKKILFKSLLVRYGIREKEDNKEKTLVQIYNELKQNEKNNIKYKKDIEKDIYKNIIHEEESEDAGSSLSGKKSKPNNIFKKLSWCSEDSVIKEKEYFEKEGLKEENDIISIKNSVNSIDKQRNELLIEEEKGNGNIEEEQNNPINL